MMERKKRSGAGSKAGDYYQYGIKEARDLEFLCNFTPRLSYT